MSVRETTPERRPEVLMAEREAAEMEGETGLGPSMVVVVADVGGEEMPDCGGTSTADCAIGVGGVEVAGDGASTTHILEKDSIVRMR